ncbi:long-chain acyl-CoA synthetase [hydrothermal vent metagenome]|uniref:Long-chain acyl-CoA synthetase n=1 Tax=hydrothermal vent metagenome TaxID=652676 RepID=A0A1W1CRL4_9ZZZZ
MTFFNTLQEHTKTKQQELLEVPQIIAALNGNITKETYIEYLIQAYHHVKHTIPLLMLSGSKIPFEKEFIRTALAEYIKEELGHQEWILQDIQNCGVDTSNIRYAKGNKATEDMITFIYNYINKINPIGFLGMVFVLETTSTQLATTAANKIKSSLNLPQECFHYLTSHGSLDVQHIHFFTSLVNQINDPKDQEDIIEVAENIFILFANIFRSIKLRTII